MRDEDGPGVLLGRVSRRTEGSLGYMPRADRHSGSIGALLADTSESHSLIIAPTGAGKGRSMIIPNLLHWPGSVIVVDIKAEAAMVTARRRREMGQAVHVIDPFEELATPGASFNPLCRLKPDSPFIIDDAFACASLMSADRRSSKEPFWDDLAESFIAGLLVHVMTAEGESDRSIGRVWKLLCSDDLTYKLAAMLDKKEVTHPFAFEQIACFLQHEGEKVRTSVRSTAQHHLKIFASDRVRASVTTTSFDVEKLKAGAAMSIYLVVPPKYLVSHSSLIRLWLSTLVDILTDRREPPQLPTLLVVDEMHALGAIPLLKQVVTLLRGYGVRAMLVLQSRDQLSDLFPRDAMTIVTNSTIVTFGHKNIAMSRDMADVMGDVGAEALFRMKPDHLAIQRAGRPTEFACKLDYLRGAEFRGRFDANGRVEPRAR